MMHNNLAILGANGHGKVVAGIADATTKYDEMVFFDVENEKERFPYEILHQDELHSDAKFKENYEFIVAIGDNKLRQRLTEDLIAEDYQIATIIHPTAVIGNRVKIGVGSIIVANVVINCDSIIGKGAIINTAATIDHDCVLGDYVHISSGVNLAGSVTIGDLSWCEIGSIIINNIIICNNCLIGAGSTVTKDIKESGTCFDVSTRKIMN